MSRYQPRTEEITSSSTKPSPASEQRKNGGEEACASAVKNLLCRGNKVGYGPWSPGECWEHPGRRCVNHAVEAGVERHMKEQTAKKSQKTQTPPWCSSQQCTYPPGIMNLLAHGGFGELRTLSHLCRRRSGGGVFEEHLHNIGDVHRAAHRCACEIAANRTCTKGGCEE